MGSKPSYTISISSILCPPSLVTSGWEQHRSGHRFQRCSCWTPLIQRTSNQSGRKWPPTEPWSGFFFRITQLMHSFGTVGTLLLLGARLSVALNAESLVVHDTACWSDAKWDARPARFATQLWHVEPDGARENQLHNTPSHYSTFAGQLGRSLIRLPLVREASA